MKIAFRAIFVSATIFLIAAAPGAAAQSKTNLPRIAYVWLFGDGPTAPFPEAFGEQMSQLGWIDGQNYVMERHDAQGSAQKLDAIMQAVVQSRVDVIVAMCSPEATSARKFTNTIPIVVTATGDPVAAGLTHSLARPDFNVTGMSTWSPQLSAKRVALLNEVFPKIAQATLLWNPIRPDNRQEVKFMQEAGTVLGIKVRSTEVRSRDELALQLEAMGWDGTQAVLESGDALMASERRAIVDRAAKLRLPAIYEDRIFVDAGGLMSYGANLHSMNRQAAAYVDKILKGAKPRELPFAQPTKFEFVVNKKAAKALGVTIPLSVLLQADEVLE